MAYRGGELLRYAPMIVTNPRHEPAVVIRHDGQTAVFVRLRPGKLGCERLVEPAFRQQWQSSTFPLAQTLELFLAHASLHGASQEALRGLQRLRTRDACVLGSLF